MKYSALTAATLLVASSLGMPELSSRASNTPGQVIITNNMNQPIRLEKAAENIILHQGQTVQLRATEMSVDLMVSEQNARQSQAEVSYTSGDQGTYDFSIRPVEGESFPESIEVIPLSPRYSPQCHPLVWYPGQGSTGQSACQDATPLRVFFREFYNPEALEL